MSQFVPIANRKVLPLGPLEESIQSTMQHLCVLSLRDGHPFGRPSTHISSPGKVPRLLSN